MTGNAGTRPSFLSVGKGAAAGLVAGVFASFAMDRFQAMINTLSSAKSDAEPATDRAASRISNIVTGHPLAMTDRSVGGQIVHYALGAALGALYGIVAEYRDEITRGKGTVFGLGVAALLDNVAVPAMGLGEPPWKTDRMTHLYGIASHIVFGTALEFTRAGLVIKR